MQLINKNISGNASAFFLIIVFAVLILRLVSNAEDCKYATVDDTRCGQDDPTSVACPSDPDGKDWCIGSYHCRGNSMTNLQSGYGAKCVDSQGPSTCCLQVFPHWCTITTKFICNTVVSGSCQEPGYTTKNKRICDVPIVDGTPTTDGPITLSVPCP